MILEKEYLRERAVRYARKFALVRNPLFYTFEGIGGNCTNFASQSVLAGSCVMNFNDVYGWYYLSLASRSASWTGVEFFYNFMTTNEGVGPFGKRVELVNAQLGDLIQLQNSEGRFYHTLVITKIEENEIYICANSNDALDRPLSSYDYAALRAIHIDGVRYDTRYQIECFDSLYSPPGTEIPEPPEFMPRPPQEPPQVPQEPQTPQTPQTPSQTPPQASPQEISTPERAAPSPTTPAAPSSDVPQDVIQNEAT